MGTFTSMPRRAPSSWRTSPRPALDAASAATAASSSTTTRTACVMAASRAAPSGAACAATTASMINLPTYAIAGGSAAAATVNVASATTPSGAECQTSPSARSECRALAATRADQRTRGGATVVGGTDITEAAYQPAGPVGRSRARTFTERPPAGSFARHEVPMTTAAKNSNINANVKEDLAPVRWGVLGAGNFARKVSLPGMMRGPLTQVVAIASRDLGKAEEAAQALGIARAYGSYEELLADPEIDVIYNPLPNHMHVEWSARAARAGKHVLCEKPIALDAREAETLIAVQRETGNRICEAFMVRYHPQWRQAKAWIEAGRIGDLISVQTAFSYFNRDATNIRNRKDVGGGALYDIGCYAVNTSRYLFGREPLRAVALIERDPDFGTDRLISGLLDYGRAHLTFTCSTQAVPYQRVNAFGTRGRIEIEIPFNAPANRPAGSSSMTAQP